MLKTIKIKARTAVALATIVALVPVGIVAVGAATDTPVAQAHHRRHHHHHHGIPQHDGGDHDADNNGGPSDGDGNI